MRSGNPFGTCQNCGKRIMWIRTVAGKNMPVNPEMVNYRKAAEGEKATEKIVTAEGQVISAVRADSAREADGFGYISHFATCPRRGGKRR